MSYKTIQNSTWSNSQIKNSTFWPYPVRVLVLIAAKWIFQSLWLFDWPFKHFVFIFTLFGFEIHDFVPFFFFFGSLSWRVNQDETKYGIYNDYLRIQKSIIKKSKLSEDLYKEWFSFFSEKNYFMWIAIFFFYCVFVFLSK